MLRKLYVTGKVSGRGQSLPWLCTKFVAHYILSEAVLAGFFYMSERCRNIVENLTLLNKISHLLSKKSEWICTEVMILVGSLKEN